MITEEILITLGFTTMLTHGAKSYHHPFLYVFYKDGELPSPIQLLIDLDNASRRMGEIAKMNEIRSALGMAHAEF